MTNENQKYAEKDDGLYLVIGSDEDGAVLGPKIADFVRLEALTRDGKSAAWAKRFAFRDADGREHQFAMPMSATLRDGAEAVSRFADEGLAIHNPKAFLEYLRSATTTARETWVAEPGWHSELECYVFPDQTVGSPETPVKYRPVVAEVSHSALGTLDEWKERVGRACRGNSRLLICTSMGFASMLLLPTGSESGGVHLVGPSSSGKTTVARVAASVFGSERYIQRWRATDNGLEDVAQRHNDALLILDEMGQAPQRTVGEIAYMLANGQGKVRASRTGEARARKSWRLLFLSTGEVSLPQHMAGAGGRARAGQEVRFVDLPADAGKGLGVFEDLHGANSPGEFARQLSTAARGCYGSPARAFAEACLANYAALQEVVAQEQEKIEAAMLDSVGDPQGTGGQVRRVAERFALIGAAGELATSFDLTGWAEGEAAEAAERCFADWLEARGTAENAEPQAMIAVVREFLGRHGEARFTDLDLQAENDFSRRTARATYNRAGWKTSIGGPTQYYFLPEVFQREVCAGLDYQQVCRVLAGAGCLESRVEGGKLRFNLHRTIPDVGKRRVYIVTDAIWEA